MVIFKQHESCPSCQSKDNLGRWTDGHAYCFGCHYYEPPTILIKSLSQNVPFVKPSSFNIPPWPEDSSKIIGVRGWTWLKKYGIMESETKDYLWSDSRSWLIFPIYSVRALQDQGREVCIAWQARNLNPVRTKPKYVTYGPV